jgi:hypothetical protein
VDFTQLQADHTLSFTTQRDDVVCSTGSTHERVNGFDNAISRVVKNLVVFVAGFASKATR